MQNVVEFEPLGFEMTPKVSKATRPKISAHDFDLTPLVTKKQSQIIQEHKYRASSI